MKNFGCLILLLLLWQANGVATVAQRQKYKRSPRAIDRVKLKSPTAVWETLVSAIERRDLNVLRTTLSKGMKNGGWASDIYFPAMLLFINPAKREYQITRVELSTHEARLTIRRSGVNQDFPISLVKEADGWKFATRKELYAAYEREIKERKDDLRSEVLQVPIARQSESEGSGVYREPPPATATKPESTNEVETLAPQLRDQTNSKLPASQLKVDEPQLSLLSKQIQNKLDSKKNKKLVVLIKDFSSPATTLGTIITAIANFNLEVGNESYSSSYRNHFSNLPKGKAGFLLIILNSYLGQIVRETGEIGSEQINDRTARLAVKSSSSGKLYWLDFVKEDGWKLDLNAASFLQKAELPVTNFDELFFDLLDFANRIEK